MPGNNLSLCALLLLLQIDHWLGLSHPWAQHTVTDKAAACAASADYTSCERALCLRTLML
jgi:hypothetical protein